MAPHATGKFGTGTATFTIFDPLCLAEKVEDSCDWWSIPDEEVAEINKGNVLFAGLGYDGGYTFDIYRLETGESMPKVMLNAKIRTIMGSFYFGAGEEVIGEDIGPSTQYGGLLMSVPAGCYNVGLTLNKETSNISVYLEKIEGQAINSFTDSPMLSA